MGNACCLGREKPEEDKTPASQAEAVVLLGNRSPHAPISSEEACQTPPKTEAAFEVRGAWSSGHNPGDELKWVGFGDPDPLTPQMISSQKGKKGGKEPNQDNFAVVRFTSGHTLACVFDGHGRKGHLVASKAAKLLPALILDFLRQDQPESASEKALIDAFQKVDAELSCFVDSGCTAVAALWRQGKVFVANAGDSRCVVLEDNKQKFATRDHKPGSAEEKARVEGCGGEVRVQEGVARVFAPGQPSPGLSTSRALGDAGARSVGVVATPEVREISVDPAKQAKIVLATDGVWEVISQEDIAGLVQDADTAKLQQAAFDGWATLTGGGYRDDVTSMIIPLS